MARDPTSVASQTLAYFHAHPGFHRCMNVARALDLTTHKVAQACWQLEAHNELIRSQVPVPDGSRKPITVYAAPEAVHTTRGAPRRADDKEPSNT